MPDPTHYFNTEEDKALKEQAGMSDPTVVTEDQQQLFDTESFEAWRQEWWGMPKWEQGDTEPMRQIIVSFSNEQDVEEFCKSLNVEITNKTRSFWWPPIDREMPSNFIWLSDN